MKIVLTDLLAAVEVAGEGEGEGEEILKVQEISMEVGEGGEGARHPIMTEA
jgi:hypothetical protein